MKHEKLLSRAFNSAVVLIIAAVLSVAIFLVFRTFERSVSVDVFRYKHELEDSVRRIAGAEYRRYFLLLDIGKSVTGDDSPELFIEHLESKIEMLGPEGDIPNLVESIGYFDKNHPETAFEYNFNSGEWTKEPNLFSGKRFDRDWTWFFSDSATSPGDLYLAVDGKDGSRVIFFRIDRRGFIEEYVKEIVESMNADFKLRWYDASKSDIRREFEEQFRSAPDQYSFRPFRILTGFGYESVSLIVEMPGVFDVRKIDDRGATAAGSSHSVNNNPPDSEPPVLFSSDFFVRMSRDDGSYYHEIESGAAITFFQTVFIFIFIGVLFILLLFQLQKTRMLRYKEKEFVASVTHELRTPLTVIRSAADNLSSGIVASEKLPVYGGLINDQSERLANMIEEILMYSNIEHKKRRQEEPVPLDFDSLFGRLQPALNSLAEAGNVSLVWETEGLPKNSLGYPDEVNITINNLVTNAVNHAYGGEKGEVRIKFRYIIPDKLRIIVEDDGRGISAREQKSIFEPFYRDSVSRQRQEKGSGLGLFISRRKAMLAGGRLSVESPYRRIDGSKPSGTRFTLLLPCILPDDVSVKNIYNDLQGDSDG